MLTKWLKWLKTAIASKKISESFCGLIFFAYLCAVIVLFIMTTIANPIYDLAFKYLMEDERVVKILLSALLRKQVVHVETRRNELINVQRDPVSVFRLDYRLCA